MRPNVWLIALVGVGCLEPPPPSGPLAEVVLGPGFDPGPTVDVPDAPDRSIPAGKHTGVAFGPADAIAAAEATIAAMCTSGYQSDPSACQRMKQICSEGAARTPYLTEAWRFTCSVPGCTDAALRGRYYLVPFDNQQGTTGCIISINVDLPFDKPGAWMTVRYGNPIHYLPFSEDDARTLLAAELARRQTSADIGPGRLQDNPATAECGWSFDFPYWRFEVGGASWYVTQLGTVTQTIAVGRPGGGGPTLGG